MAKYNHLRSEKVLDALCEYIDQQDLKPGDSIPSERQLCEMFQVSRGTVREAVRRLCAEGMLRSAEGKGTFLAREKEHIDMKKMISFSGAFQSIGKCPGSRVVEQRLIPADGYLAGQLKIAPGDPVHFLRRIRTVDDRELLVENSHIPAVLCPGLEQIDFNSQGLYGVLEKEFDLWIQRQDIMVQLSAATEEEGKYLSLMPGAAVFVEEAVAYDRKGRIVEFTKTVMDAAKANYTIQIDL